MEDAFDEKFIEFIYNLAERIIKEFDNVDSNDKQIEIVAQAKLVKIFIEKAPETLDRINEGLQNESGFEEVRLSKNLIIFKSLKNISLVQKLFAEYSLGKRAIEEFKSAVILDIWNQNKEYVGVEKYFNTPDELFNSNAFFWRIKLKTNGLFDNTELPYELMSNYFYFLENSDKPISCVNKLFSDFENANLSHDQILFILDNFTGMLFHGNNNELVNIYLEIVDRRNSMSSYLDEPEIIDNLWSIEKLRAETNELGSIPEKKRYLKLKKLEYQKESERIGFDIGIAEEIDVELEFLDELGKSEAKDNDTIKALFSDLDIKFIGDNAYSQLIDYILVLGKNLEKFKDLTVNFNEERCRDYFLPFLNSISENLTATGETFNRVGKTDILIQNKFGDNIFIGECKLWNGQSKLSAAIDQLLDRYINWRDEKAAIIIFNKSNSNFTKLIETSIDTFKCHGNFDTYLGKRKDTAYSFVFKHPTDTLKTIKLELILFNFK